MPEYTVIETEGSLHAQNFVVACQVEQQHTQARGTSRRRAEQAAADLMLSLLGLE